MNPIARASRRAGFFFVGVISVVAGGAALWGQLTPDTISHARTVDLLMVLALLVLPAATLGVLLIERRHRAARAQTSLEAAAASRADDRSTPPTRAHPPEPGTRFDRAAVHAVRRQEVRFVRGEQDDRRSSARSAG